MTATTISGTRVHVRDALHDDDAALRAIAAACPMEGDVALRITREPDFFQLNQLEGSQWRVGVAEVDGARGVCDGCRAGGVSARCGAANVVCGRSQGASDDARYRGRRRAYQMGNGSASRHGRPRLADLAHRSRRKPRDGAPNIGANSDAGRRALRDHSRVLDTAALSSCVREKRCSSFHGDIARHRGDDGALAPSGFYAPTHTRAHRHNVQALARERTWLDISNYRLARDASGRLAGFMAWWDQVTFKQSRVLRYSPRLRVRALLNGAATVTRGVRLPDVGRIAALLHGVQRLRSG